MRNEFGADISERLKHGIALLAVTGVLGAGALSACGRDSNDSGSEQESSPTTENINPINPETTETTIVDGHEVDPNADPMVAGTVTPGNDETVRAEDDAGLYECGGVQGEDWENTPFTPDRGLIPHMNENQDLAESDYDFWTDVMSEEGFDFLAENALSNANHDEDVNIEVDGVPDTYGDFIERQVSTPMQSTIIAQNHACLDSEGNYRVFPVGMKQLTEGDTNITGLVLETDDFANFRAIVNENGGDFDSLIIQELDNVDTNGDGEGDTDLVHVGTKHEECGNNEVEIPPEDVPVPTTTSTTPDTTGITTTVPTSEATTTTSTAPTTTPTTRPATTSTTRPATTTTTTSTTRPATTTTTVKGTEPPCDPDVNPLCE